jgi:hypothetical protein
MARKEKRYHYIYKTTCKITNKFYVGMHSTDNLEDGYIGSGKKLMRSVNKHGKENHVKEILEFLSDRSSLKKREAEIINEQFLQDPLCMNIALGGCGFSSGEHQLKCSIAGAKASNERQKWLRENDPEWSEKRILRLRETGSNNFKKAHAAGKIKYDTFTGKQHSEETKQKIGKASSQHQAGSKNSQYGTCWITNGLENKKIKKTETVPDGWRLGKIQK